MGQRLEFEVGQRLEIDVTQKLEFILAVSMFGPLDVRVFWLLNGAYNCTLNDWCISNPGIRPTIYSILGPRHANTCAFANSED